MKDLPVVGIESRLRMLTDEKCQKIYDAALTIIAEIGMTVPHAEAREMLVGGAGATVEANDVVEIPRDAVAAARDTIPRSSTCTTATASSPCSSAAADSFFGTGSDLMSIYDFETGERRQSVLADAARIAHLATASRTSTSSCRPRTRTTSRRTRRLPRVPSA